MDRALPRFAVRHDSLSSDHFCEAPIVARHLCSVTDRRAIGTAALCGQVRAG